MTLKYELDSLEGLDDGVAKLYKEADGKFVLDVSGVTSKKKVDEFRERNIELLKEMDKFKGIDPEKYRELQAQQQALEDEELIRSGDVDKVIARRVEQLNAEHSSEVSKLTEQLSKKDMALESLLIDSTVREAAIETGVLAAATNDVLLRAKSVFSITPEGEVIAKDSKGEPMFGKDGVTPLSVAEWTAGLKKSAPHLFTPSTGGGAQPNLASGQVDTSNMTAMQKISAGLGA